MENTKEDAPLNTHGVTLSFGKYKGTLITRVPLHYIKWMINDSKIPQHEYAQAEFLRRGDTMPLVEISGHAIDNASFRVLHNWLINPEKDEGEGFYSWLQRMTLQAVEQGVRLESGKIKYLGMKLVIEQGEEFPVLVSIMK